MGAGLFAEAGRNTGILDWEALGLNLFATVHSRDRLLRRSDEIHVLGVLLIVITTLDLVEVLLEVGQLASLMHDARLHEERWLQRRVALFSECAYAEVDQSLVQEDANAFQEVSTMLGNFGSTLNINHVKQPHDLVMM